MEQKAQNGILISSIVWLSWKSKVKNLKKYFKIILSNQMISFLCNFIRSIGVILRTNSTEQNFYSIIIVVAMSTGSKKKHLKINAFKSSQKNLTIFLWNYQKHKYDIANKRCRTDFWFYHQLSRHGIRKKQTEIKSPTSKLLTIFLWNLTTSISVIWRTNDWEENVDFYQFIEYYARLSSDF